MNGGQEYIWAMNVRKLYINVLLQAFKDAVGYTIKRDSVDRQETKICRVYLTRYSRDLQIVCDLAGVDVDVVLQAGQKMQKGNWDYAHMLKKKEHNKLKDIEVLPLFDLL